MCLVTSCSSCGIVSVCDTNFRQTDSDKRQAQADTDVRTRAEHRMTTTHWLHDTGRHQRALSVHRRPPTVSSHLKSQSSCTAHPRASQSTTVVTITNCGCSHTTMKSQFRYQGRHDKSRRNFIHCVPLLKEFLCEMDHRNDTTQNPPSKIHQEVPSFIHCSKAARCNRFAIVSVSRVCQNF